LLYVGSEEPRKNLKVLLEAVAVLRKEIPEIVLLKVGSPGMGGDRKATKRLIKSLQIEDRIYFTGDVSEEMLAKYYNAADIFVFPSLYEGFGLPIIEAMACGCPVVASNTTSIPEILGDAGILIYPLNSENMAESILELLNNTEKRNQYIKNGLIRIFQFNWDEAAKKMLWVYSGMNSKM
jgi:glycosyltransferase involved in cell wall biosynthesis